MCKFHAAHSFVAAFLAIFIEVEKLIRFHPSSSITFLKLMELQK
jgi:hypothetical protein